MNDGLDSIIFFFWFYFLFLIFLYFILDLGKRSGMTSYVIVIHVTKCDRYVILVTVTVTPLCDIKKVIEGSGIDNII